MIKRFAWFLFKSPQRRWVGWQTLYTDFEGLVSVFIQLFRKKNSEKIWICVGTKNRSDALLHHLIKSMSENPSSHYLALSVADCNSIDVPELEKEIKKIWHGELVFSNIDQEFHRTTVFNRAISQASGNVVFVADADISLPLDIVKKVKTYVSSNSAWFPVCQWQLNQDSPNWKWFTAGTGLFGATKKQLEITGYYDESIKGWGKEDWELFFRFYQKGIMPLRSRCKNLFHHWHDSSKPKEYQNLF